MTKTGDSQNSPRDSPWPPSGKTVLQKRLKLWRKYAYNESCIVSIYLKKHSDILYMVHWLGLNSQAAQTFMYIHIHLFCINKNKATNRELHKITTNFLVQNHQLFLWGSNMKVPHGSFLQMYDFLRPDNFTLKIDTLTPFERFQLFPAKKHGRLLLLDVKMSGSLKTMQIWGPKP